ncbi:MAG: heme ABC exporter ATP-binding protein CcmA [Chloroflexi bacterium]|nr:heme ABC exporter ATP-binding protein CcmA [Chloroflexota bacterium]
MSMESPSGGPANLAIQVRNLSKAFGGQRVLRDLDLRVEWGQCLALFGPNGSGKTTLIKVLGTLTPFDGGDVLIAETPLRRNAVGIRRAIGLVSHQTFLYGQLTAEENLRFYCRMFSLTDAAARIGEMATALGFREHIKRQVHTLSHGMQKRVSLARALLHRPSILLLDEPETGLDPEARLLLEQSLERHRTQGGAVLMTTHNIESGFALADQVAILAGGRIAFQAPRRTLDSAAFQHTYTRFAGGQA